MKIKWEEKDGNFYAFIEGELTVEKEELFLKDIYQKLIEDKEGRKGFVLDFSRLTFVNSSGISVFENVYKLLKSKERKVSFLNLPDKIKEIFFFLNVPFKESIK